ncbi:MAG: helix-turn-helix domain-containing protein [Treponema sp.]|jgi:transcriptional regulator with XRE-family HTH domain|nr:helix-turn-helix domain-containing protein [Treponema sp.]
MGFRENLKAELSFADMRVKELAALSGLKKQTIDSYLREKGYTPSVEAAVRIAQALGVTVEYLVTGQNSRQGKAWSVLEPDLRSLVHTITELPGSDQKIVIKNAACLANILRERKIKNPKQ